MNAAEKGGAPGGRRKAKKGEFEKFPLSLWIFEAEKIIGIQVAMNPARAVQGSNAFEGLVDEGEPFFAGKGGLATNAGVSLCLTGSRVSSG